MKKNISIFSVFVLSILALLTFCNSCVNSDDSNNSTVKKEIKAKDVFIIKQYGNLKPRGGVCREPMLSNEYEPYDKTCKYKYYGEKKAPQKLPIVNVKILIYQNSTDAYDWFIHEKIREKNFRNKKGYSEYEGKNRIITHEDQKDKTIHTEWISGYNDIKISAHEIYIPSELIQDYIAKYPPTVTFQSSDFDEEELIRDLMAKEYEGIMMLEGRRDSSRLFYKKTKELYAMINQCDNEMLIRCILGMADDKGKVECSTTYIIDDDKRARKWKELKSKIDNKDIVYDNVVWHSTNLKKLKCSHDKDYEYHKKMVNLLEMTREDLKNWPMFQNYVETEKEQ